MLRLESIKHLPNGKYFCLTSAQIRSVQKLIAVYIRIGNHA